MIGKFQWSPTERTIDFQWREWSTRGDGLGREGLRSLVKVRNSNPGPPPSSRLWWLGLIDVVRTPRRDERTWSHLSWKFLLGENSIDFYLLGAKRYPWDWLHSLFLFTSLFTIVFGNSTFPWIGEFRGQGVGIRTLVEYPDNILY